MSEDNRPMTLFDIELEVLKRTVRDPRLPERGTVSPSERVLIFKELVSEYIDKVVDEYYSGVWKG